MNEYKPIGIDTAINLLSEIFGVSYNIQQENDKSNPISGYSTVIIANEKAERISQYGTPVIGNFSIINGDVPYKYYDKNGVIQTTQIEEFEFPLATIVDFSRDKNIVTTPTIGSGGTVKEIFGFDDWKINIRGICLYDESRKREKTATEQQKRLIELSNLADSLKIKPCKMFSDKEIGEIVIESISFPAIQGKPNMIPFEINAISDMPFMLKTP